MPKGSAKKGVIGPTPVEAISHSEDQRTNIPTAELETFLKDEQRIAKGLHYPRPSELLFPRDPAGDPQLVWQGKDDQDREPLRVPAPPIYIQEKIHPKALIEDLRARRRGDVPEQADLFSDFNGIAFEDLVEFYQHEQHWSNRMILGDSLEVMASLAEREGLRGQVQCIYIDPPYGIRFSSNWQVSTRKRNVSDTSPNGVSRQPEQVKAFRDTWQSGIHSYLSYLRDRLVAARDLLSDSGSCFVQIGDENAHLVRALMDEVFGARNFVSQIVFTKTGSMAAEGLGGVYDIVLWFARDRSAMKQRPLFTTREPGGAGATGYTLLDLGNGSWRPMTKEEKENPESVMERIFDGTPLVSDGESAKGAEPFTFRGQPYTPPPNTHWKTHAEGRERLILADRVIAIGKRLEFKRYFRDFPLAPLDNMWLGMGERGFAGGDKVYVVQTDPKVIARCILMSTDPGDLVLDPTCGSGTTAYAAELWGRRWITIDTSRVALALARQRLIAAQYPHFRLADTAGRDIRRGFEYMTVPHVTLKSIANNPDIRPGMSHSEMELALARHADQEVIYDQPVVDRSAVRVTGPFTVESLSPLLGQGLSDMHEARDSSAGDAGDDFRIAIIDNLKVAGVQNTVRKQRLNFDHLEPWPGRFISAKGTYLEDGRTRTAAVAIGPQYGTVDADFVREAGKEAAGYFDLLVVCGFAFDAYISDQFRQLGNLTVLKASMNPDLSMGGDLLKKTGTGNLFTVFGEPDIDIQRAPSDELRVEIRGVDVYDPTTGEVRAHSTDDIACWFLDTAYDGNSFFVRHAYFTGAGDPYKSLKAALKADVDERAWASLYATVSRPFQVPPTRRIAVKVINHYGDEVMKVYEVGL